MRLDPIQGVFAPIPTPFDEQGAIDPATLGRHMSWLADRGLKGALVLGSNGEFPSLSLRERRSVAEAAAHSRLRLILNVGSCSLPEALELVHTGSELGYEALLCPPPFYFNAPTAGVASFLLAVLDAARLPVLLYNIPQRSGVPLDDPLLDLLDGHPNLAGVKDSSGDPGELQRLSRRLAWVPSGSAPRSWIFPPTTRSVSSKLWRPTPPTPWSSASFPTTGGNHASSKHLYSLTSSYFFDILAPVMIGTATIVVQSN